MELFDILFPQDIKCVICNCENDGYLICDKCYKEIPFLKGKVCAICGGRVNGENGVCLQCMNFPNSYTKCYAVMEYTGKIKGLVNFYKNDGAKYFSKLFSYFLNEKFKTIDVDFDLIIPVPISDERRKTRGYNQVELMLEDIARGNNNVDFNVINKIKDNPHQTGLSRNNRTKNISGTFKVVDKSKVKDKIVLVVDDIYTTGATLNEITNILLKAGASKVYGLVLCRSITEDGVI